jgi:hypothetical protein
MRAVSAFAEGAPGPVTHAWHYFPHLGHRKRGPRGVLLRAGSSQTRRSRIVGRRAWYRV